MGYYKYVKKIWENPRGNIKELMQQRLTQWRKDPVTLKIERPTRIDRARNLGYKPKQGIFIVRQRVARGGRLREHFMGGRRPKHMRRRKIVSMSYQWVAEARVADRYKNCEVLNSYEVGKDGIYLWYEVIMVDRDSPAVLADKNLSWINNERGRVYRGLSSAGKRSRGILTNKGKGAEKLRPSLRAHDRKSK